MFLRSFRLHFAPAPTGDLPARILAGKWGRNPSVNGDYIINETTVRELPRLSAQLGFDTFSLDFEHNTVPGSEAWKASQEPRKIAATGTFEIVPGEGLYYIPNTALWTPEGKEAVTGKHYPDISPAIVPNDAGEVVFVHSVALCRQGATEGLHLDLHAAGLSGLDGLDSKILSRVRTHNTNEQKSTMPPEEIAKLFLAIVGLDATATADQIKDSITSLGQQIEAGKKAAASAQQAATDASAAKQETAGLKTTVESHSASITALIKRLDDNERAHITAAAIRDGKLIPQSAAELSLDQFRKIVADLPAGVVPMERRTPEGIKTHAASPAGDATQSAMLKAAGVTVDDFKKYNS
ncbi:phage protease [Geminisphaera colitermitum]|uniref:phage protease n=1 Tax=Geminisphaera colitermitum TaxID=1148786 RepID=UPI000158C616|nr:phage protease [Geminisphaera colitermitum]